MRIYGFMITNIILSFHLFILHYDLCPNLHSIPSFPLLPFPKSSIPWCLSVSPPTKYRSKTPKKKEKERERGQTTEQKGRTTSKRPPTRTEQEANNNLLSLLSDIPLSLFSIGFYLITFYPVLNSLSLSFSLSFLSFLSFLNSVI